MSRVEKELPNDLNAEAAFLSALIHGIEDDVFSLITENDFYRNTHKVLFKNIKQVYESGNAIDLVSVNSMLKRNNEYDCIGGYEFLINVSEIVVSGSMYKSHLKIILEKSRLRKLIISCNNAINDLYKPGAELAKISQKLGDNLYTLGNDNNDKNHFAQISECLPDIFSNLFDNNNTGNDSYRYVSTGFDDIDDLIYAFKPGQFIILAARPSIGKSMLALNIAFNASVMQNRIAFFSLEMNIEELILRLISSITNIPATVIDKRQCDNTEIEKIVNAGEAMIDFPIYINHYRSQTIASIKQQIIMLEKKVGKIDLVILDYLQLMCSDNRTRNRDREKDISDITRSLKILAGELNLPILALSQLNRESVKRVDKKPILSDLRESGAIEQDADKVLFIHREWEYDKSKNFNLATIIVGKNRQGKKGECQLAFEPQVMRFSDIEHLTDEEGDND